MGLDSNRKDGSWMTPELPHYAERISRANAETAEWLGNAFGSTVAQSSFYNEVFEAMLKDRRFYPREVKGWSKRSRSEWLARLSAGTNVTIGLNVLTRKREGWSGAFYYKWHPNFLARLFAVYGKVKKGL